MDVLMLTSTLPRFAGDMQAGFVREQAEAWLAARSTDTIAILAPGDVSAPTDEQHGRLSIKRFNYHVPARWQTLAYPAILPNIRRNPLLALQVPGFLYRQYRTARRLVRDRRSDLVYAHWAMPQGLVAWLIWKRHGVPYVLQTHSTDLSVFHRLSDPGRRIAARLLQDCAAFFCVNSRQLDEASALLPREERAQFAAKSTCLPMGITLAPDDAPKRDCAYDIASIGRLSSKKGFDCLIAAAELLAARGCRPRIGIAGDGEDRASLEAKVKAADVTFAGFLSGEAKETFLASSRCLAFPSRTTGGDTEGMPVALLEALARGKPVLASRDTNIELLPEWDRLGESVILVPDATDIARLADAMQDLLAIDPAVATEASGVGARYCWTNLIHEYLAPILASLERIGKGGA